MQVRYYGSAATLNPIQLVAGARYHLFPEEHGEAGQAQSFETSWRYILWHALHPLLGSCGQDLLWSGLGCRVPYECEEWSYRSASDEIDSSGDCDEEVSWRDAADHGFRWRFAHGGNKRGGSIMQTVRWKRYTKGLQYAEGEPGGGSYQRADGDGKPEDIGGES